MKLNSGGAPVLLARKIPAAKKEAAKARAGKKLVLSEAEGFLPPTPFLFARPSVQFWFCSAKGGAISRDFVQNEF
jgi:hypothetical protein